MSPVRAVALLEAAKGALVLVAATGLLALVHRDLHTLAAQLVAHAHLNPAAKYPAIFLDAANHVQDRRLVGLAIGAAAYAALRFVEAAGLWLQRVWAEALAAASGAVYLPFEVLELVHRPGPLPAVLLVVNLAVVALMLRSMWARRQARP